MKLHRCLANLLGYDIIRKKKSHHTFDLHLQKMLANQKITTILDVGANKGQFALRLRALGYRGKIISFEPVFSAFLELKTLAAVDSQWQVYNYAVGSQKGMLELNVTDSTELSSFLKPNDYSKVYYKNEVSGIHMQKTEIRLLKDFIEENNLEIDSVLLKTDTQGFDIEVLKGAGNYLASLIKVIVVELSFKPIYENMPMALDTMQLLKAQGFNPSGLFPISRDKKTLELIEIDGVFLNKRYVTDMD